MKRQAGMVRVLLCFLLLSTGLASLFADEGRTVRVGYTSGRNFMQGGADDVAKSGFGYDYLQIVSYYTNWEYTYVYGDWYDLREQLKRGEIDLLAGVSRTTGQPDGLLFPDEPMGTEDYYIYVPSGSTGFAEEHPYLLRGLKVGVNKNSVILDNLEAFNERYNLQLEIIPYADNQTCLDDYMSRKIDAVATTNISLSPAGTSIPAAHIGSSEYYLAVAPEREDLLEDLNRAQRKLRSSFPDFPEDIWERYLGHVLVGRNMTREELDWLQAHKILWIGYSDGYPPFCFTDRDGNPQGVLTDILESIFSNEKSHAFLKFRPYQNYEMLLQDLKRGSLDIALPILNQSYFAEREGIYQSNKAIEVHMQMVYLQDFDPDTGRLAVSERNQSQAAYTSFYYPSNPKVPVPTLADGLKAIKDGKADAMIVNSYAATILLQNETGFKANPLTQSVGLSFGIRKGESPLVSLLNRGIALYGDENIESSLIRNTKRSYQPTLLSFVHQHMVGVMAGFLLLVSLVLAAIAVTVYRRQERRLYTYMAHYDSTTLLLNRRAYEETIDHLRKHLPMDTAVVEIDINGLKETNDTKGHDAGDALIRGTAQCLIRTFGTGTHTISRNRFYAAFHPEKRTAIYTTIHRHADTKENLVFRTGGDEFTAIIHADREQVGRLIEQLHHAVSIWHGPKGETFSIAIGLAMAEDHPDEDIDALIRRADHDMYRRKQRYYQMPGHNRRRR